MGDKILRKQHLVEMIGVTMRTIDRWEKEGTFPNRIVINPGGRAVGWLESEVLEWLMSRSNAR